MGKRLAVLLLFVLVGALCPAMTFAQGRRGGFGGGAGRARSGPVQMDERTVLDLFSAILNLNDSQQQQLHSAFDAAVISAVPIATQIASNKEAVIDAVEAGKSDDQVKALTGQEASLSSQMLTLEAQTFSKMWAILNSDQRSRVDDLMYDDIGEFLSGAKPTALPGSLPAPIPQGRSLTLGVLLLAAVGAASVSGAGALAKSKPVSWKPIEDALLRVNDVAVKDWSVYQTGKKRDPLLLQMGNRFLLIDVHARQVYEVDPSKVEQKSDELLWDPSDHPARPLTTSEWTAGDIGAAFRINAKIDAEKRVLDLELPHPPDVGDLPVQPTGPQRRR